MMKLNRFWVGIVLVLLAGLAFTKFVDNEFLRINHKPFLQLWRKQQELDKRRDYAVSNGATKDALNALDDISLSYEEKIWSP